MQLMYLIGFRLMISHFDLFTRCGAFRVQNGDYVWHFHPRFFISTRLVRQSFCSRSFHLSAVDATTLTKTNHGKFCDVIAIAGPTGTDNLIF